MERKEEKEDAQKEDAQIECGNCDADAPVDDFAVLQKLAREIEQVPGLVKDRKYRFKSYKQCLIASELVDYIYEKIKAEASSLGDGLAGCEPLELRQDAIVQCERLFDAGLLHHVANDHTFKDEYLFYFICHEDSAHGPSVKKICKQKNARHGKVLVKGKWLYSSYYAVLSREDKNLYLFSSELGSMPLKEIDFGTKNITMTECLTCPPGCRGFEIKGPTFALAMCLPSSENYDEWLHSLECVGIEFVDADAAQGEPVSQDFYGFSALDIDGKEVSMRQFKGRVVVVVNVASF